MPRHDKQAALSFFFLKPPHWQGLHNSTPPQGGGPWVRILLGNLGQNVGFLA